MEPGLPGRPAAVDHHGLTHIPQICATPGFVGARRYDRRDGEGEGRQYLAIYEIEADDVDAARRALWAHTASGEIAKSDALATDPPPVVTFYELIDQL